MHPTPYVETCCDDPDNQFEDDSEDIICDSCGEHTTPVCCKVCKDIIFQSSCCG